MALVIHVHLDTVRYMFVSLQLLASIERCIVEILNASVMYASLVTPRNIFISLRLPQKIVQSSHTI